MAESEEMPYGLHGAEQIVHHNHIARSVARRKINEDMGQSELAYVLRQNQRHAAGEENAIDIALAQETRQVVFQAKTARHGGEQNVVVEFTRFEFGAEKNFGVEGFGERKVFFGGDESDIAGFLRSQGAGMAAGMEIELADGLQNTLFCFRIHIGTVVDHQRSG